MVFDLAHPHTLPSLKKAPFTLLVLSMFLMFNILDPSVNAFMIFRHIHLNHTSIINYLLQIFKVLLISLTRSYCLVEEFFSLRSISSYLGKLLKLYYFDLIGSLDQVCDKVTSFISFQTI